MQAMPLAFKAMASKEYEDTTRHQCLVYEGAPSAHLVSITSAIRQKLRERNRCLYLNSPPMVAGMRSYLAAAGVDVARETEEGNLELSSEQGHLLDGSFDIDRMIDSLAAAVKQAMNDGYQGLWATGDMSWEFGYRRISRSL